MESSTDPKNMLKIYKKPNEEINNELFELKKNNRQKA